MKAFWYSAVFNCGACGICGTGGTGIRLESGTVTIGTGTYWMFLSRPLLAASTDCAPSGTLPSPGRLAEVGLESLGLTGTETFTYTVGVGDTTNGQHLNYSSTAALTPNGGTITEHGTSVGATLGLPAVSGTSLAQAQEAGHWETRRDVIETPGHWETRSKLVWRAGHQSAPLAALRDELG